MISGFKIGRVLLSRVSLALCLAAVVFASNAWGEDASFPSSSGLRLWFEADKGITLNSKGQVSVWSDQALNMPYPVQDTGRDMPLVVPNALNGLPVVRFNGQNIDVSGLMDGAAAGEIIAVVKVANKSSGAYVNQNNELWDFGRVTGYYKPQASGTSYFHYNGFGLDGSSDGDGFPVSKVSDYHIFDTSSGDGLWAERYNGVIYRTATDAAVAFGVNTSIGLNFAGDFAEILVYDRVLTQSERDAVHTYLVAKYAPPDIILPPPPAVKAYALSSSKAEVYWTAQGTSGSNQHLVATIERQTDSGPFEVIATASDVTDYIDGNILPQKTYSYRVKLASYAGESDYSASVAVTTGDGSSDIPVTGLRLWLRSTSGTNLGPLAVWADQSGLENNATQQDYYLAQPNVVPNALNGYPVVRYTGNQLMNLPNLMNGSTAGEIVAVLKSNYLPNRWSTQWGFGTSYGTGYYDNDFRDDFGISDYNPEPGPSIQQRTQYHVEDVSVETGSWISRLNGTTLSEKNVDGVSWRTNPVIGQGDFSGDFAEVLIFNRVLTADERAVVVNYLNSKYTILALPLSTGPLAVATQLVASQKVNVSWNGDTTDTSYVIQRQVDGAPDYQTLMVVQNALGYSDSDLTPGHSYTYTVIPESRAGDMQYSGVSTIAVPVVSPTDLTARIISPTQIGLSWTGDGFSTYTLERKTGEGDFVEITQLSAAGFVDVGLEGGTTYTYRIKASSGGQESDFAESAVVNTPSMGSDFPVADMQLWLRADAGAVASDGGIGIWRDLSGKGNDAFQVDANSRPQLTANQANNEPSIQFNGATDMLHLPDILSGASAGEIFIVAKVTDFDNGVNSLCQFGTGYGTLYFPDYIGADGIGPMVDDFGVSDGGNIVGPGAATLTNWHIYNASVDQGGEDVRFNGNFLLHRGFPNWIPYVSFSSSPILGVNSQYQYLNGEIAEVIVYNKALTDDERTTVTNYLKSKYNTVIADSDFDGLDDEWEMKYFNTLAYNANDDPGNTGRTLLESQAQHLNPWPIKPVASGLRAWYRADFEAQVISDSKVYKWGDLSGQGNHTLSLEGEETLRPTLVPDGIGGQASLHFDGISNEIRLPDIMNGTTAGEIFIVTQLSGTPNQFNGLAQFGTGDATVYADGSFWDDFGITDGGSYGGPAFSSYQSPHIYNASVTAGGVSVLRLNGATQLVRSDQTVSFRPDPLLGSDSFGEHFAGDIAEVIIYDHPLTDSQRNSVNLYLAGRYGVETPLLDYTVTPDASLAAWWPANGVGQEVVKGNHEAQFANGISYAAGEVGQAFVFNGTNQYGTVGASSDLDVGASSSGFTVEFWAKAGRDQDAKTMIGWGTSSTDGVRIWQYGYGTGLLVYIRDTNGTDHTMFVNGGVFTIGEWTHVAVTYDKTAGIGRLYKNGTMIQEQNLGVFTPKTDLPLTFGASLKDGNYYQGALDEISLYTRPLTITEVAAIYQAGAIGKEPRDGNKPPVVNAGPDVQVSSVDVAAVLNGSVTDDGNPAGGTVTSAWNLLSGPGTVTFADANAATTTATFSAAGTYILRLDANDGVALASDVAVIRVGVLAGVVPDNSLSAWWPADGDMHEVVHGGHDAELYNGASLGDGKVGQAFVFNGVNQYGTVGASSDLDVGASSSGFTVEFWAKAGRDQDAKTMIGWGTSSTDGVRIWQYGYGTGLLAYIRDTSGTDHTMFVNGGVFTIGEWTHVAVTYDKTAGIGRLYKNGTMIQEQNLGVFTPKTDLPLTFGASLKDGNYYQGALDEIHIYTAPLSAVSILAIFQSGESGLNPVDYAPTFSQLGGIYSSPITITINSKSSEGVIYYTTDGTAPIVGSSSIYEGPITISQSTLLRSISYTNGVSSVISSAFYRIGNPPEQITALSGLSGSYYDSADFGGSSTLRLDAQLNNPSLLTLPTGWQGNGLSARWTGELIAQFTETHTFTLTTNGGVRLWFGNDLVLDDWSGATSRTLTFARDLTTGTHYPLRVELQRRSADVPQLTLQWSGFSTIQQIIPQSQFVSGLANPSIASTPTATPGPGAYADIVTVTLGATIPSANTQIRYTLDNSEPTEDSALYVSPIIIEANTIVKARTYADGYQESGLLIAGYNPSSPIFSRASTYHKVEILGGGTLTELAFEVAGTPYYLNTSTVTATSALNSGNLSDLTDAKINSYPVGVPVGGAYVIITPQPVEISAILAACQINYNGAYNLPLGIKYYTSSDGGVTWDLVMTVSPISWTGGYVRLPIPRPDVVFSPAAGFFTGSFNVSLSTTLSAPVIYYTTDGSTPQEGVSTQYTGPFTLSQSALVRARAFNSLAHSNEASALYRIGNAAEAVTAFSGLSATYYQTADFGGSSTRRLDAQLNNPSLLTLPTGWEGNGVSARWTGELIAQFTETHTFTLTTNGGVRLWFGNDLVLDDWSGSTSRTLTFARDLTARTHYPLRVEFQRRNADAPQLTLQWSGFSTIQQIIPQSQFNAGFSSNGSTPALVSGLLGEYYTNMTLSGTPALLRNEAVSFDWGSGSPDSLIRVDQFSVRWTGAVIPAVSGGYTFSTISDDGVRLWLNDQLIIDNWADHGPTINTSNPISLTAGVAYNVRMEYYENGGGASIRLLWTPPGQSSASDIPIQQLNGNAANALFVATPTATPAAGLYGNSVSVALSTTLPLTGAQLYYTLDGSDPTNASALYSAPITLNQNTTLKAIAYASGLVESGILVAPYTLTATPPALSALTFNGATVPSTITTDGTFGLTATDATGVRNVQFFLDGNLLANDTVAADGFTAPFSINAVTDGAHTLTVQAWNNAGLPSAVFSAALTVTLPPSPAPTITAPADNTKVNQAALTIRGTSVANTLVTLYQGASSIGSKQSGADGSFAFNVTLTTGLNTFSATATNRNPQPSPASALVTVTYDNTVPAPPQAVTATGIAGGKVTVSWQAPLTGLASGYYLFRSTTPFTSSSTFDLSDALGGGMIHSLSFTDTPPANGRYYYMVLTAYSVGNGITLSAPAVPASIVSDSTPPSALVTIQTVSAPFDAANNRLGRGLAQVTVVVSKRLAATPFFSLTTTGAPIFVDLQAQGETTYTGVFTITASTPSGLLGAIMTAVDVSGNRGTQATFTTPLTIDTAGPQVTGLVPAHLNGDGTVAPLPVFDVIKNDPAVTVSWLFTLNEAPKPGTTPSFTAALSGHAGLSLPLTVTDAGDTDPRTWVVTLALPSDAGAATETLTLGFSALDDLGNPGSVITPTSAFQVYQGTLPPLAIPAGLSAQAQPAGAIALTWTPVTGVSAYVLQVKSPAQTDFADLEITPSSASSYTYTPSGDGAYAYRIASVRTDNGQDSTSGWSPVANAVSDRTAPGAPTSLSLGVVPQGVQVTWLSPSGGIADVAGYELYRSATAITTLSGLVPVLTGIAPSALTAVDAHPAGTTPYYALVAIDQAGNRSAPAPGFANVSLLPVGTLSVTQSAGGAPALAWQAAPGSVIDGYHLLIANQPVTVNQTTLLPSSASSYTDTAYASGDCLYTIQTVSGPATVARSILLPAVSLSLVSGAQVQSGLMNTLQVRVQNASSSALTDAVLTLTLDNHTVAASAPITLAPGAETVASVVVGGYADLSLGTAPITLTLTVNPEAGETVTLAQPASVPVIGGGLTAQILPGEFVRGGTGSVRIKLTNPSSQPIEFKVARQQGAQASDEVRLSLLDPQAGTVLSTTPVQILLGDDIVTLADGTTVVRVPAGGTYTSPAISLPVPVSAPSLVNVALQIDSVYFDYGHPDTQVTLAGPRSQVQVSTRQTSYSAAVTSVSPASSNGSSPITIQGLATWRATDTMAAGTPAPGVSVVVSIANNGFIRQQTLLTDANGLFTYVFTPGATENGGIYQVWASHPDVITPPDNPSTFTITRVLVSPTTFNIRAPRNYTQALPVTISTGPGTTVANLRAVLVGTLPAAVNYTTQTLPAIAPSQQVSLPLSIVGLAATPDALPTGTLTFNVVSDDGAGGVTQWATLIVNYTFTDAVPIIQGTPATTQIGVQPGQTASGTVVLQNQGFAALEGATLSLVSTDNTAVPAWIRLQTPAALGTLDIGASATVTIGVAAPSDTLLVDKVYSLYLRVSGPGITTVDFPVTVTVSPSGQGGALLKLVDPYYQLTLPGDATNTAFDGVAGASVVLDKDSSTGVPTATFTATSDANGEVSLSSLPAGRYTLRISAAKHDTYVENITIQPGVIYTEQVPLVYAPVSFNWSVVPVTFQDTYNLTLTATFETNVPVPVMVIEPGAINLPKMCAGQVYTGEFSITNHGLIDATDVTIPIPPTDDNFSYELLSSFGDKVKAGQTVTVAFRIKCLKPLDGACDQVTTTAALKSAASNRSFAQTFAGHGGSAPANAGCSTYSQQVPIGYKYRCANGVIYQSTIYGLVYSTVGTCGGGGTGSAPATYNGGYGGFFGPGTGGTGGGSTTGGSTAVSDDCFPQPLPCNSPGDTGFEQKDCRQIKALTDCNGRSAPGGSWVDLASRQFTDDAKDLFLSVPGGTIGVARNYEFDRWTVHVADPLYSAGVPGGNGLGTPLVLNGRAFTNPQAPLSGRASGGDGSSSALVGIVPLSGVRPGLYQLWGVGPEKIVKAADGTYVWSDAYGNERAYDVNGLLVSRSRRGQLYAQYLYNSDGQPSSITDRAGRTVMTFTYADGHLVTAQDMSGRTVAYTYDANGRLDTVTSPLNTVMTYTYDTGGHLIGKRTHLAGQTPDQDHQTTIEYHILTNARPSVFDFRLSPLPPYKFAPPNLIVAGMYDYGDAKNSYVTRISHNTGESKSFVYKFNSSTSTYTVQVTDATGRQEVSTFDANGVLSSQTVNGQQVYAMRADTTTRVITRGANENTTEEFNEQGYITRRILPDGGTELYEYDPVLNLPTKATDPSGKVTTYTYDALGNTLTMTEAVGTALQRVTTNTYKPGTNLLTLTSFPGGRQTAYVYDDQDRLITTYDPAQLARQTTFTHDDLGRILTTTDALNRTTTYIYDAEDHVISETNSLGEQTLSTYQGDQLVQREVGHTATATGLITRYTYDSQGRRLQEKRVDAAGQEHVFKTFAYDNAGNILTETDALGQVTSYRYDAAGNLAAVSVPADDGTRSESQTSYDALARPVETIDPVGNHTTTQYDLRDHPSLVIEAAGTPLARTTTYAYDLMGRVLTEKRATGTTTYTYDILGRRTARGGDRPYATTTTYDSADRVLTQTDALGRVTSYGYDTVGQLTAVRLNGTVIEAYAYDLAGNRLSVTDGVGNHRHTHYDALNRADAESIALSSGQSAPEQWWTQPAYVLQATAYTPFGQVASVTRYNTVNGTVTAATTTRAYDAFGRPFTETDPAGLTVTTTYDLADNVLQIAYPAVASSGATTGSTVTYLRSIYNAALVDGVIDRAGNTTRMTYDAAFRVVAQTNSLGGVTQRHYDALGRVDTETDPSTNVTTTTYDAFDQPLTITYPDHVAGTHERIETFAYDSHGKLLQKGGAGGYPLVYTYDAVGNLLTLQDANAHVTTWTYTPRNQVATKTYADSTAYLYTYDAAGRLLTRKDALNRTTTYAYNAYGQPTGIDYPTDTDIGFTYDNQGHRVSMIDGSGTTTWTYDALGRPASETQGRSGPTLTFGYDTYSQRTSLDVQALDSQLSALGSPWHTGYGYDNAGRLRTVLDARLPAGQPYTYTYAPNAGLVAQITTPTGLQLKKTYDNQGRLLSTSALNSQLSTLNSASYTYDAAGQRNTETTPDHARTFTYDAQRQLTDATGTVGASDTEQFSFAFDGIGNRQTSQALSSSLSALSSGPTTYQPNAVNQYTALTGALADTLAYDANGNTTGLNGKLLAYDEENRLKQVSDATRTITYIYDGLGRRVERIDSLAGGATTGVRYVYDGWRVIEETDQAGTVLHSYTRGLDLSGTPEGAGGIGGLLAMATPSGGAWTAASYAYDGNGNVTDLFNDNGTSAAHYTYGPFGERLTATGALADVNTVQFSSKERDTFTGFYYYGLRYYNPNTGRWMNREPLGESESPNLYGMVGNDSVNHYDLNGLYGEAGHFYTTYLVARAAGYSQAAAYKLAYYSQYPDEDSKFDAIGSKRLDVQYYLHSLRGNDPTKLREYLECLLKSGKFTEEEKGLLVHALGDTYAHAYPEIARRPGRSGQPYATGNEVLYSPGLGHALAGHTPDYIGNNPAKYGRYVDQLYSSLSGQAQATEPANPALIAGLKAAANGFHESGWADYFGEPQNGQNAYESNELRNLPGGFGGDPENTYFPERENTPRPGQTLTPDFRNDLIGKIKNGVSGCCPPK